MTVSRIVSLALLLGTISLQSAQGQVIQPEGKTRLLLNFEDAAIWSSENQSPFEVRAEQVSQGGKSLRVQFTNKPTWSNIWTDKIPGDWSGFRYLNLNVYLEGELPGQFGLWVRDKKLSKAEGSWPLGPGWNTLTMDLDEMQRAAGLDRAAVIAICLYKETKEEITVHLDNLYLSVEKPVPPKAEPVAMPDKELLGNPGFEELTKVDELGSPFAWWTARRWSGPSFLGRGEKGVFAGKSALMLDGRGPCKIGVFSPAIKIASPTKLRLTAMVQADGLKRGQFGQTALLSVADNGERALPAAEIKLPEGSYGWKKVELVFDVPARTPVAKVFVQLFGPGRIWVDDLSLTGVDLQTATGLKTTDAGRPLAIDPPIVTEPPELLARKAKAVDAMNALKTAVEQAKAKNLETRYAEIPLKLGDLAFNVRWDLPDHLSLRQEYCDFITQRCQAASQQLAAVMTGQAPDLKVPEHPDTAKLKLDGPYFTENGQPRILFSMQYHNSGELLKWFTPNTAQAGVPAVGASRYDFKQTPIWEVYQKNSETHRVYDNGWCGHIIRDQYSAGGDDRCVINLEHPQMRQAIAQSIAAKSEQLKKSPRFDKVRYINIGFEYAYRNYDPISLTMYRKYLAGKYGQVDKLNAIWKTQFKSFDEVPLPPYDDGKPAANPAAFYDWGAFNVWRFTDYLKWATDEIHKHLPGLPTTTGGGNPFGSAFWSDAIDEEALSDSGVCGLWLSETGSRALGVTSVMDLQRSIDPNKPILDPEYHALPDTCFLMFLHGCGLMDYWWWPDEAGEFYESSLKHSPTRTLLGVETVMKTALDVRRLPAEIAAFRKAPTQLALLYPKASLIQQFPKSEGHKTPYSLEMEKTYSAAVRLDASVGFITSKQVLAGKLQDYKVLAITGARFVEEDVYAQILDFVRAGGTVVVTPTSLIADEYNRRRNYLDQLGLQLVSEELPEIFAAPAVRGVDQAAGELDFIQGPVARTVVAKEPKRQLLATEAGKRFGLSAALAGEGILQTVTASKDWMPLANYEGNNDSAILYRKLGQGEIYYLAAQLSLPDRKAFFDKLMTARSFTRPIRALSPDGKYVDDVESRTVEQDGTLLTYLHNLADQPRRVKLSSDKPLAKLSSLSTGLELPGAEMELAPYETRILRIESR